MIKDIGDHGEMTLEHAPMNKIWADMLTNLLHGKTYKVMCCELMNMDVDYGNEKDYVVNHPMLLPTDNCLDIHISPHNSSYHGSFRNK